MSYYELTSSNGLKNDGAYATSVHISRLNWTNQSAVPGLCKMGSKQHSGPSLLRTPPHAFKQKCPEIACDWLSFHWRIIRINGVAKMHEMGSVLCPLLKTGTTALLYITVHYCTLLYINVHYCTLLYITYKTIIFRSPFNWWLDAKMAGSYVKL